MVSRFIEVLVGTAIIILSYYLLKELLTTNCKEISCIYAILVAVNPLLVGWSRESREYIYIVFFSMMVVFLLLRLYRQGISTFTISLLLISSAGLFLLNSYSLIIIALTVLLLYRDGIFRKKKYLLLLLLFTIFIIQSYWWLFNTIHHRFDDIFFYISDIIRHDFYIAISYVVYILIFVIILRKNSLSNDNTSRFSLPILFLIMLVILSFVPRKGVRYLLFVYPFFLMAPTLVLYYFKRYCKIKYIYTIIIVILITFSLISILSYNQHKQKMYSSYQISGAYLTPGLERNYELRDILFYHNDYKSAYKFFNDVCTQGDVIVISSYQVEKHYSRVFNHSCALMENYHTVYTITEFTKTQGGFLYIVVDHRIYMKEYIDDELLDIIRYGDLVFKGNGIEIIRYEVWKDL